MNGAHERRQGAVSGCVALGVLAPIPSLGAEPGDVVLIRRGSARPVLLQRELLENYRVLEQAIVGGAAKVIGEDSDPITLALLKQTPAARTPLRLIRGGAR